MDSTGGLLFTLYLVGPPILMLWVIILVVRKIKDSTNSSSNTAYAPIGSETQNVGWENQAELPKAKKRKSAWQILLIIIGTIAFLYFIAGICVGIYFIINGGPQ